jgi:transcription elongation factor GreA
MSQIAYVTEEGLRKLKEELHYLKTKERPSISNQIAEARKFGHTISAEEEAKILEESKNWVKLASEKTDEELLNITSEKRNEYNPAFIIAAELEIEKRKL